MSKDVKPKQRIGRRRLSRGKRIALWCVSLLLFGGGAYAAYHYVARTVVEVPVQRVRRGEFVLAVRTRGEVRSTRSKVLSAPQVPYLRIVKLAVSGGVRLRFRVKALGAQYVAHPDGNEAVF